MNGATNDSLIREGFRSNNGVSGHDPNHSVHHPGRKRGWDHGRGASSDRKEGCHVKLYVAPVPRTATEASIRPVFEGYGPIVEVVLVKDKNTGQQQGYCFVKYATLDGAERAIRSLNNLYTFPGELSPLLVKFSDGERKRLEVLDRVFVGGLNKFATKKDIEEVFSPFGHVEDVFIVCDDQKRSRGYGFVKFSNRDMALAAIKGLNGIFTMKGCHQPLIVRFADPKKPRTGEPRPPPNVGDSAGGRILPMAPNHSTVPLPQAASHVNNWGPATGIVQQPFPPQQPLSQLPPMLFQPTQTPQMSTPIAINGVQRQSNLVQSSSQNIEQQFSSQIRNNPPTLATSTSPEVLASPQSEVSVDCNWSEHTCPDGHKYYYNCITCESRWEKPQEYIFYEQMLQKQKQVQNPSCQLHSPLPILPSQQVAQTQKVQSQMRHFHQNPQQPSSSAQEKDHIQLQSETSPVVCPTCV